MILRIFSRTKVTLSKDGSCFIARHAKIDHPYKQTLPFPEQTNVDESVLRVDAENMITKAPNLEQVQALTYTPEKYWRQTQGLDKRIKYMESFNDEDPGMRW